MNDYASGVVDTLAWVCCLVSDAKDLKKLKREVEKSRDVVLRKLGKHFAERVTDC